MLNSKNAREELENILSKKEYTVYHKGGKSIFEIWWEKAQKWLADHLEKWFPSFEPAGSAAVPIMIIAIAVVIIGLSLAAFLIIRNSKRNRLLRNQKPLKSREEMNWSYQRHLTEADIQEGAGEYTLSTRHLFLALLLYFDEKEWLTARIWKTNWEYYDELRKVNQQYADRFYLLASFFDEVTYGERKVQRDEYLQFRSAAMEWFEENEPIQPQGERRADRN